MTGYVRIHRALLGHPAFRNESETMAFAWLIAKASWKPTRVRYKGRSITLQRGQLAISQRDMAAAFDRDKAWVERLWRRLKSEAMIETATEAGVAVITICNYGTYQADTEVGEAAVEAPREAVNEAPARQRRGTEQRTEEINNTPLPPKGEAAEKIEIPDWIPAEPWRGFVDMRKRIKKPLTPRATELAIAELDRLRQAGHEPGKVLDRSVLNSWQGLFELPPAASPSRSFGPADPTDYHDWYAEDRRKREEFERRKKAEVPS